MPWRLVSVFGVVCLFWLSVPSAFADSSANQIVEAKVITDSTDCESGWTRVGTDLQEGSWIIDWLIDTHSYYLCYRRGEGTPITSIYPVSGTASENRDCDSGDTRFSGNLNTGSVQEDYLCSSTRGQYPLADIDVSTVLKSGSDAQTWTLQRDHRHGRDFNFGFILLYIYDRDTSQLDGNAGCGSEGERACDFFSSFFWNNGSGACDRGLQLDGSNTCVNGSGDHARHSDQVKAYLNGSGKWAARALADMRRNLDKDVPLNWMPFINAHNAFNTNTDGNIDPNQWYSMSDQLALGARWLELDIHSINGFAKLCHGESDNAGCTLSDRLYSSGIKEIAAWLNDPANKDEIVLIQLEDYATDAASVMNPIQAYFGDRMYTPTDFRTVLRNCPTCALATDQPRWPTPREMLAAGKRVIVMDTNRHNGDSSVAAWTYGSNFDAGVYAKDWDGTSCLDQAGYNAAQFAPASLWTLLHEDRTLAASVGNLVSVDSWRGLIDPTMAGQAATCGVTKLGYDMLGATNHTLPNVCSGNAGQFSVASTACDSGDKRIDSSVWGWKQGEPNANATNNRAMYEAASGRWVARSGLEQHHFLCGDQTTGSSGIYHHGLGNSNWGGGPLRYSGFYISAGSGPWEAGAGVCAAEGKGSFVVPISGVENTVIKHYQDQHGITGSTADTWLNYASPDGGATWQIVPDAAVTLEAERADGANARLAAGVKLAFSASSVPPGASVHWLFGDGAQGFGANATHTYERPGSYTVTFVVDTAQQLGVKTFGLGVADSAPDGSFWVADNTAEGSPFVLQFLSSIDTLHPGRGTFTYAFDCGDGLGFHALQSTPALTCQTDDNGARTVRGQIIDERNNAATFTSAKTVHSVPPSATVDLGPLAIDEGQGLTLSVANIVDVSKPDTLAGFKVDFDCGIPTSLEHASTRTTFGCRGMKAGSYTVAVTIADKDGSARTYSQPLTVNPKAGPRITVDRLVEETGQAIGPGNPALLRATITLSATITSMVPGETPSAIVNWGDAKPDTQAALVSGASIGHWYDQPGDYTLTLSATGKTATRVVTQTVHVVKPEVALKEASDLLAPLHSTNRGADGNLQATRDHLSSSKGALALFAAGKYVEAMQNIDSVVADLNAAQTIDPTLAQRATPIRHEVLRGVAGYAAQVRAGWRAGYTLLLQARTIERNGYAMLAAGDESGALEQFYDEFQIMQQ